MNGRRRIIKSRIVVLGMRKILVKVPLLRLGARAEEGIMVRWLESLLAKLEGPGLIPTFL